MTEHSAGAVVVLRDEDQAQFLLILDGHGNWGFPKGHLENRETILEAAVREVAEETGITQYLNLGHLGTWTWEFVRGGDPVKKICDFFLFAAADPTASPQESEGITEIVWLPLEEARSRLPFDSSKEALKLASEMVAGLASPGASG
jgi:bis(5'-nucleosidyl)-tetraphosphatase